MIQTKQGNVLDIEHGVIVHGCNSHGVMRSGIAKEVRERWPGAFEIYVKEYIESVNQGLTGLPLGGFTIYEVSPTKYIINAITQKNYGRDPNIVYLDYVALGEAFQDIANGPITNLIGDILLNHGLHFPLIGCGLANGKWDIVGPIIDRLVSDAVPKTLWMFQP
jgi:O-acetyl-ADP-ribose deacetylase (regulator of RNase III)